LLFIIASLKGTINIDCEVVVTSGLYRLFEIDDVIVEP
jgi:hypothetical protein